MRGFAFPMAHAIGFCFSPARNLHLMRRIDTLVIHCSASPNGGSLFADGYTPVQIIDAWHKARGFNRDYGARVRQNPNLEAIGYHYVIYTNGAVATGRALDEAGAHVKGHNACSIGVCLLGTDQFGREQWTALTGVVTGLTKAYPQLDVVGHRDLSPDRDGDGVVEPREWLKTCPGFDVAAWRAAGMAPPAAHLLAA